MPSLQDLAYAMELAYRYLHTQGEAVEQVKKQYPNADINILWAMWYAIDAYVDKNL